MLKRHTLSEKAVIVATFLMFFISYVFENDSFGAPLILACALFVIGVSNLQFTIAPYHVFTLQFCLYCYATAFWALNGRMSISKGNTIFITIVTMSAFYAAFSRMKDNVNLLLKIIMWSGYLVIMFSYFYYGFNRILGMSEGSARISNAFNNVNVIGMMAALVVIIHFYLYLFEKHRKNIILIVPAIIIIGATQSRKAVFEVIFGVFMLYYLHSRRGPKNNALPILKFIMAAVIILGLVVMLSHTGMFSGAYERMMGMVASWTGEGEVDASTSLRAFYRQVGWEQFLQTPLLGVGIDNSPILLSRVSAHYTYLHCNYAELAACGGLVGLISYYSIHTYILYNELKYIKIDASAVLFFVWITAILLTDWGTVSYYSKRTYFNFMIFFLHIQQMRQRHPHIK